MCRRVSYWRVGESVGRDLGGEGAVDGDALVVDAEAVAVGVSVGEQSGLEHLVGGGLDAGHHVGGGEGQLLHLKIRP